MEFINFVKIAKEKMEEKLGADFNLTLNEVTKNNGVKLFGLTIKHKNCDIAPTVYMEPFYQACIEQDCFDIERITDEMVTTYHRLVNNTPQDVNFIVENFKDFEKVKNQIVLRLINSKSNKELLENIPHFKFLDMAIGFHYILDSKDNNPGCIVITNDIMKMWNTTPDELLTLAKENSPKICSAIHGYMHEFLPLPPSDLYIITNQKNYYGAAVILYSDTLKEISNNLGGDFFLMPSSVHDCIALATHSYDDGIKENLKSMISAVNQNDVAETEFLSKNLYYYNSKRNSIKIVN